MEYRNKEIINYVESISMPMAGEKRELFFPKLINALELKTGAEIGVDKGGFSKCLLDGTTIEKFWCVDPWIDDFGSDHRPGYFDKKGDIRLNQAYQTLKADVDTERAILVRATGVEASKMITDESLDIVYIDGDHSLEGIFNDLYSWVPKVRVGGIVAGHDYKNGPNSGMKDYFGNQLDFEVKTAVDFYCKKYGYKVYSIGPRVPSWMFVKV